MAVKKKAGASSTVTLKHLAAAVAEEHEMAKKHSEAVPAAPSRYREAPQEGDRIHRRARHPGGARARRAHGPSFRDGEPTGSRRPTGEVPFRAAKELRRKRFESRARGRAEAPIPA